ncbi:hypothetical protein SDC9_123079 [bioreactor metagenome]|uniref:Uncharacterized protein n=1 Tax=bioreactor metagenome TaxID=1076179 RepID=A0A645CGM1_9ZZZZ
MVAEDVDPAEFARALRDHRGDFSRLQQLAAHKAGFGPQGAAFCEHRLRRFRVPAGDRHARPAGGEGARQLAADAAGPTRDEDAFFREIHHLFIVHKMYLWPLLGYGYFTSKSTKKRSV